MMKKMTTKLLKIFAENVWLSVAAMIILMAVFGLGWKWSLYAAGLNRADDSVKALLRTDLENTDATSKEKIVDRTDWYLRSKLCMDFCSYLESSEQIRK